MSRQKNDGRGRLGGRTKGTPNKATSALRPMLEAFIEGNFEEAAELWHAIPDPDKKLKLYLDVMSYVLPKPQSIELSTSAKAKTFAEELAEIEANGGRII